MYEQSKAARRRYNDGDFHLRYFVGAGLDIGAGLDSIARYINDFPRMQTVREWDIKDGDAQYLATITDKRYDFVHSSHCLEHMVNVSTALLNWFRVLKSGGHLILTVPDEDMYERGVWPSANNSDHKHTFTMCKAKSWSPVSINVVDLVKDWCGFAQVERIVQHRAFFDSFLPGDQTLHPNTECAIELIFRKL